MRYLCSADGPEGGGEYCAEAPVKRETGESPVQSRCCVSHLSRFSAATARAGRTCRARLCRGKGGKANRAARSQKTCHQDAPTGDGARVQKAPREGRTPRRHVNPEENHSSKRSFARPKDDKPCCGVPPACRVAMRRVAVVPVRRPRSVASAFPVARHAARGRGDGAAYCGRDGDSRAAAADGADRPA